MRGGPGIGPSCRHVSLFPGIYYLLVDVGTNDYDARAKFWMMNVKNHCLEHEIKKIHYRGILLFPNNVHKYHFKYSFYYCFICF